MNACTRHQQQLASMATHGDAAATDPILAAHLAGCPCCQRLAIELRGVGRHLETLAADLPQAALSLRVQHAVAQAIREPKSPRRAPGGWWVALTGVAALLALLIGGDQFRKHSHPVKVDITPITPSRLTVSLSPEEPPLSLYQAAFRQSEESLNALLDAWILTVPASPASEPLVALRANSRME